MVTTTSVIDVVLVCLFMSCAGTYFLRCMHLFERESHEGPLQSPVSRRYVLFKESGHIQKVALFDWLRRPFGVYQIASSNGMEEWLVDEDAENTERFTCPFCLSLWTMIFFSVPVALWIALGHGIIVFFVVLPYIHLFMAAFAQVIYEYAWGD